MAPRSVLLLTRPHSLFVPVGLFVGFFDALKLVFCNSQFKTEFQSLEKNQAKLSACVWVCWRAKQTNTLAAIATTHTNTHIATRFRASGTVDGQIGN